jgi:hypothetical protein
MYKNKFEKWALRKNNRRQDVEAILHRKAQRDAVGKSSQFFLRGRLVRLAEVERYAKRNKVSLDTLQSSEENMSADLSDLICCTPPPGSLTLRPECHRGTEKFFYDLFTFTMVGYDEIGVESTSSSDSVYLRYHQSTRLTATFNNTIFHGAGEYRRANMDLAGIHWRKGFATLDSSITNSQPHFMLQLFYAATDLSRSGCSEIAVMLRNHASQIADARLSANHPRRLAYSSLVALEEGDFDTLLILASKLYRCATIERFGESSKLTLDVKLWVANLLAKLGDHTTITEFQFLLSEVESQLGRLHGRVLDVLLDYGTALTRLSLFNDAATVLLDLVERTSEVGPDAIRTEFAGLVRLGDAQFNSGNLEAARSTLITALSTFERSKLESCKFMPWQSFVYNNLAAIASAMQHDDEAAKWGVKDAEFNEYVRGQA